MGKLNKNSIIIAGVLLGICISAGAQVQKPRYIDPKAAKITHTMIANASFRTFNNMSCELVVLMAVDHKSVKVVRTDPPAGRLNASYIVEHPEAIAYNGININLEKEFDLRTHKVESVRAQINFDDRERNVILVAILDNGEQVTKTRSVDAEFFRDHAEQCLK